MVLVKESYVVDGAESLVTPSLVYYEDLIRQNTEKVISLSGGTGRLWPHVKTFKMGSVIRILMEYGIKRFKAATIAEAEMCAIEKAEDVLMAYPLVGVNIHRFISLALTYPETTFWAIGDDISLLSVLSAEAEKAGLVLNTLLDVNIGMNRTGGAIEDIKGKYREFSSLKGIRLRGLHCFSGNFKITDIAERKEKIDSTAPRIMAVKDELTKEGFDEPSIVFGSTPSLPCYLEYDGTFLSPGTAFITDMSYFTKFPDLPFLPAACLISRVISKPRNREFTLDCGYKHIAAEMQGDKGLLLGYEDAEAVFQCEEHWAFRMPEGKRAPELGEIVYILPTHICPTTAMYPYVYASKGGSITGKWPVTARDLSVTV